MFIRPNLSDYRARDALEPLVFAVLKTLTPDHVDVVLFDDRIEPIPMNHPTDLVAMTVDTYSAKRAYQIAAAYRRRGIPVVMGGHHPTLLQQEVARHADTVVIGDADGLWEQILHDAETRRLKPVYHQNEMGSMARLRYDRSIYEDKKYSFVSPVQCGRGCRYACDFCSVHAFYGDTLQQRPVRDVVAEIEDLESRHVFLVDDNIFVNENKARELFQALIPLKIRWSAQVSIDVANNDQLVKLMAKSGCFSVTIGFESLDARNLAQMKKKWNLRHGDYAVNIQKFRDNGILIYAAFIFGYDHDTPDSIPITVDFAVRSKFYLANFNPLMPLPGTALYDRLKKEGRLIMDPWWLHPDFRYGMAAFQPRGMTPEQLQDGCWWGRREFNRATSVFKRALDLKTNCRNPYTLGIYLYSNWVSKKEIYHKQAMAFGRDESRPERRAQ